MTGGIESWLAVGDLDELVREVDRLCDRHLWDRVDDLRLRCRAAIERGHQLWPAASYAEYRVALDAPSELAASVVVDGAGWMAPGPLAEVVAQNHTFADLAPHLEDESKRRVVAAERVLRGEEVPDSEVGGDMPGRLAAWEPAYLLADYSAEGVGVPTPELSEPSDEFDLAAATAVGDDVINPEAELRSALEVGADALADSTRHWASASEGTVRARGTVGEATDALVALGCTGARWREADLVEVAQLLAWAAADGGAHGRRRGAAAGRFELWWTLACLSGVEDDWPTDPSPEAKELRYGLWLPTEPVTGWSCRITVEDPADHLAWALDASDAASG